MMSGKKKGGGGNRKRKRKREKDVGKNINSTYTGTVSTYIFPHRVSSWSPLYHWRGVYLHPLLDFTLPWTKTSTLDKRGVQVGQGLVFFFFFFLFICLLEGVEITALHFGVLVLV